MNISRCDKISDEGIRALANGLPQLQSLDIGGCRNFTDAGIRALASGCRQLQSLEICNNIWLLHEGKIIEQGHFTRSPAY